LASTNKSSAEMSKPSDHWRMIMEDLTCTVADHLWLPESSLSVLVGRHGAMNPAGRVCIRNIMPIARDYRCVFLFDCFTRAEHGFIPPDAGVRS
jgi:hypothetical protein